ncbi:hypothetical protein AWL63_21830 [Sphingomonas panacis]|uniref:EAL domain-containing protein n=1 Tax=Sphingomonas panacis TaxID=1560345 RepID=A0A1B3ZFL8_9SPHN|nr:EAL domain-containing protein [Sphingomonas panacis]AOH86203.1 hypothetical protein AWL63_21830 [Sphingomonas panacis]
MREAAQRHRAPRLFLGIANLRSIGAAFGDHAAIAVRREIGQRFDSLGAGARPGHGESASVNDRLWEVDGDDGSHRHLQAFTRFMAAPVVFEGFRIHASLAERGAEAPGLAISMGSGGRDRAGWGSRYHGDMALAADLFENIFEKEPLLARQAIHDAGADGQVLYHECLLRRRGDDGTVQSSADGIQAMERLGLIRALDRIMVLRVLRELQNAPDVRLGVNISAQSATCDFWWSDIVARLSMTPGLAERLVIEITETSAPVAISEMVRFADRMRGFGCRIALDDFGVGHASIDQLLAIRPDIAKIDALFLRRAQSSPRDRRVLHHLVGLAASVSDIVIIEGVESEADSALAREAGSHWQQGYLFGRPTVPPIDASRQ